MYKCRLLQVCCLIIACAAQAQDDSIGYKLGPGDRISIQVFDEEDLSLENILVGDSGEISFPFIGKITVTGMTPEDLDGHITESLKGRYLIHPEVTVSIVDYRKFYVGGHVKNPGGFPFQPGMTVRMAISLAGGFEERANKKGLTVVHGESKSKASIPILLDDPVQPGDVITVERSFF